MAVSRDEEGAPEPLGPDPLDLTWTLRAHGDSPRGRQSSQRGVREPGRRRGPPPGRLASSYLGPESNETLLRDLVEQTAALALRLDAVERRLDLGPDQRAASRSHEPSGQRAAANGTPSSAIEELHAAVDKLRVDGEALDLPPDKGGAPGV